MALFTDSNGRAWHLHLRLGHRKQLKDLGIGFDGKDFGSTMAFFVDSCNDPDTLAKVIHLISDQKPDGVTADQLADTFDGATYAAAVTALTEEVVDFFHHGRPATAAAAKQAVTDAMADQDRQMAAALTRSGGGTSSPASSELTLPA